MQEILSGGIQIYYVDPSLLLTLIVWTHEKINANVAMYQNYFFFHLTFLQCNSKTGQ